jgi:hypothetical protein
VYEIVSNDNRTMGELITKSCDTTALLTKAYLDTWSKGSLLWKRDQAAHA